MRTTLTIASFLLIILGTIKYSVGQIIIEDPIIDDSNTAAEVEIFGYRNLPKDVFAGSLYSGGPVGIPLDFASNTLRNYSANIVGNPNAYTDSLQDISREISRFQNSSLGNLSEKSTIINVTLPWTKAGIVGEMTVDAALISALVSENINNSGISVFSTNLGGESYRLVEVNNAVATQLMSAYNGISAASDAEPDLVSTSIYLAEAQLAQLGGLRNTARLKLGFVSYGRPIVYTAEEKNLSVPSSVSQDFEVYWIEFAISLREINSESFNQIDYIIQIPPDSYALALVPLSYGVEVDTEERTATPSVSVSVAGNSVTVGEFLSQTVAYRTLRPTIIAVGLQENQFYWRIKEEALNMGAIKFVSIIAVPKETESLSAVMFTNLRFPDLLGIIQGDVASTEPTIMSIGLGR